jgi:hypothetical protein
MTPSTARFVKLGNDKNQPSASRRSSAKAPVLACFFVLTLASYAIAVYSPGGHVRNSNSSTGDFLRCKSAMDCSLNGECTRGSCMCDNGWKNPPARAVGVGIGGPPCSILDVRPSEPHTPGFQNDSWPSWGGRAEYWPEDQQYHLFVSQFANECGVNEWVPNSFVSHATAPSPVGPWTVRGVALPSFAHNPQVALHPDGTWLLFFIGGWHTQLHEFKDCSKKDTMEGDGDGLRVEPAGAFDPSPGLNGTADGCGPGVKEDHGCGIRLAHARSPFGPWTVTNVTFLDTRTPPDTFVDTAPSSDATLPVQADWVNCRHTNPSPFIDHESGKTFLAFQGGSCHGGLETLGIASADNWAGPYTHLRPDPLAPVPVPACRTGQFGEDPYLWRDHRGWHIIAHALCDWDLDHGHDLYAVYLFSLDAVHWTVALDAEDQSFTLPYRKTVEWTNGSVTMLNRMERPTLVLSGVPGDTNRHPAAVVTAVCAGPQSVGSCGKASSWTLMRPLGKPNDRGGGDDGLLVDVTHDWSGMCEWMRRSWRLVLCAGVVAFVLLRCRRCKSA